MAKRGDHLIQRGVGRNLTPAQPGRKIVGVDARKRLIDVNRSMGQETLSRHLVRERVLMILADTAQLRAFAEQLFQPPFIFHEFFEIFPGTKLPGNVSRGPQVP